MSTEELKPCPFCDSDQIVHSSVWSSHEGRHVQTYECKGCHSFARVEQWNTRAQLAAIQGGMGEDERAEFEADFIARWKAAHPVAFGVPETAQAALVEMMLARNENGEYANLVPQQSWLSWSARGQRITAAMAAEVERLQELCECNTAIMRAQDEALSRVNKERDALRAELAEVKGREAVALVRTVPGTDWKVLDFVDGFSLQEQAELTRFYASPPASPDVDGLVKNAARYEWLRDHYHGFEHYRKSTGTVANLDREIDEQIAAISTWRQSID